MFFQHRSLKQKLPLVVAEEKTKKAVWEGRGKKKEGRKAEKTTSVAEIMHHPGITFPHIPVISDDSRSIKITGRRKKQTKGKHYQHKSQKGDTVQFFFFFLF